LIGRCCHEDKAAARCNAAAHAEDTSGQSKGGTQPERPSKSVFQLHGVNAAEQPILRKKLSRREMVNFLRESAADYYRARSPWWISSLGEAVKFVWP
jgi:hypothetical protein